MGLSDEYWLPDNYNQAGHRVPVRVIHGKESPKVLLDCTICSPCCWPVSDSSVPYLAENRHNMAGLSGTTAVAV